MRKKRELIRDDVGANHDLHAVYLAISCARAVLNDPKEISNYLSARHGISLTPIKIARIASKMRIQTMPILMDIARGFGALHLDLITEKLALKNMALDELRASVKGSEKRAWIMTIQGLENELAQLYDLSRTIMDQSAAGSGDMPVIKTAKVLL